MTDARTFRGYRFPAEVILWAVAQAAEVTLAHPEQLRRLPAAQFAPTMATDRLDNPGHSYLR